MLEAENETNLIQDRIQDQEEENVDKTNHVLNTNELRLNENDLQQLKSSILFKNWDDSTFNGFVNDRKLHLERFKYKEVIAKEKDCMEKLFIIKSGVVLVWIKVKRLNLKKYQKVIERYNQNLLESGNLVNSESKHYLY